MRKLRYFLLAVCVLVPACTPTDSSVKSDALSYNAFIQHGWSPSALDRPVGRLLALAGSDDVDTTTAWGAVEMALREGTIGFAQRAQALGILEKLVTEHPDDPVYRARAVIHLLRWPSLYKRKARKLAQVAETSDNALFDYALAACALEDGRSEDALEDMRRGNACPKLVTYERQSLVAGIRALERIGYTPFAARMVALFQPETPHMRWMYALGLFYRQAADDEMKRGQAQEARAKLSAVAAMAEQLYTDSFSLTDQLACIKIARTALERLRTADALCGDFAGSKKLEGTIAELNTLRSEIGAYIAARNRALQPDKARAKSEAQWVTYFDRVLQSGELQAVRADPMILQALRRKRKKAK